MGAGGGMNPAAMMTGIAMGGAMGQQMAGMMGNMVQGINQPPAGMPPPPPVVQYNVAVNGQSTGPYTFDQLRQMAAQGQFTPQSLIWKQGMSGWTAAGTMAELLPIFAQSTPPPVPQ